MNDRKTMYDGLSCAAWGYLFLILDINLGTVSILPRFVGWLLFLDAIEKLKGARRDLALLRPLGILMALWTGADWLASWVGGNVDGLFLPLDLVTAAAAIYFHFQFLTDLAALAETYCPEEGLRRPILRWRAAQTVLITVIALVSDLPPWLSGGVREGALLVLSLVYCILGICLMAAIFSLRRCFKEEVPDGNA